MCLYIFCAMDNLWWYGLYRRRTSIDMNVLNYQFRGDQVTKTQLHTLKAATKFLAFYFWYISGALSPLYFDIAALFLF